jgi:hypothetical protein
MSGHAPHINTGVCLYPTQRTHPKCGESSRIWGISAMTMWINDQLTAPSQDKVTTKIQAVSHRFLEWQSFQDTWKMYVYILTLATALGRRSIDPESPAVRAVRRETFCVASRAAASAEVIDYLICQTSHATRSVAETENEICPSLASFQ